MYKKLCFIVIFFACIGLHCIAQQPSYLLKELDGNGNISYVIFRTDTVPQPVRKSAELLKNLYSLRNTDEFKLSETRKEFQDESGFTHQYYQQFYKNVKVEHGEATVHTDKDGNIETLYGYYKPVGEVDTNAKLSEEQALKYALEHIGAEVYKWQIFLEVCRVRIFMANRILLEGGRFGQDLMPEYILIVES